MSSDKIPGWGLTAVSVIGLASSMVLTMYLVRSPTESRLLDALKSLLFRADPVEVSVHAPPLINLSQANTLLVWFAMTAIIAISCIARAAMTRARSGPSQSGAATIVISVLTIYCLWNLWPQLAERGV